MTTAREAMARAIMAEHQSGAPIRPAEFSGVPSFYGEMARAAVLALLFWLDANGYQIVPKEPTETMFCHGDEAIVKALDPLYAAHEPSPAQQCYRAMLAAAPSPDLGQ